MSIDYVFRGSPPSSARSSSPAIGLDIISGTLYATANGAWAAVGSLVSFSDKEVPVGSVDGINTSFILSHSPIPPSSLILVQNGLILSSGTDYTLSGSVITMLSAPSLDDLLEGYYRF